MAIPNIITKGEGNKGYAAHANIVVEAGYLKDGDTLDVQVEIFNQIGNSLGIQGLVLVVSNTLPDYVPDYFGPGAGGIKLFDFMKSFTRAIDNGWDPFVNCWASEVSRTMCRFNIQPQGGDTTPFPIGTRYEFLRLIGWVFTEA